jgi:hypothetical protein
MMIPRAFAAFSLCVSVHAASAAPAACIAPSNPTPEAAEVMQANGRLLAGLRPTGVHGSEISATRFWQTHAAAMDADWAKTRERALALWRGFSEREVDAMEGSRGPLYYPFSGPDFMYAHTLFPRAPRYLLIGLEDPGAAPAWPQMNEAQAAASLAQLRQSTSTLMRLSFFRTNSMKQDLKRSKLAGVAPVMMSMAARSGFEVRAVDAVHLGEDGALCMGAAKGGGIGGVRLQLAEAGKPATRELVYLQADLSDRSLANTPQLERHVRALGAGPVFLKAASYLLHRAEFSVARSLVLERASMVLQDDSGIPYTAYSSAQWNGRLYGSYSRPIALFKDRRQDALREAYVRNAQPLDSGIGYSHRPGTSNLQVFEKRVARSATQQVSMR